MRIPLVGQSLTLARRASSVATDTAGRAALAGLDAVLNWRYTDEAVERVLASPAADRAVPCTCPRRVKSRGGPRPS